MPAEAKTFRTKDGEEYTFLFDIDGICAAEDAANASWRKLLTGALIDGRLGYLRALTYGGLKSNHPEITLAETWTLLDGVDGKALGIALRDAIDTALPERRGTAKNPRKAASGTGSRSSPPGAKKASTRSNSGSKRRSASS